MSDEHKVRNEDIRSELERLDAQLASCKRALDALRAGAEERYAALNKELAEAEHGLVRSSYRLQGAITALRVLLEGGTTGDVHEGGGQLIELASH